MALFFFLIYGANKLSIIHTYKFNLAKRPTNKIFLQVKMSIAVSEPYRGGHKYFFNSLLAHTILQPP
jgi:hypothetical protein